MLDILSVWDLVVRGRRVALPGGLRPAALAVRGGRVAAVEPFDAALEAVEVVDAGDRVVLPGLVDTHVHVNDPGRAEWEGWETATRAAAAGGVTTIVDMPLNSVPPTTTREGLEAKLRAAEGRCRVDYGLWGGVVPGTHGELEPLLDAGVLGFKAFMVDSGVPEFPPAGEEVLRAAMRVLAARGAPLLVHAEDPGALDPGALAREPRSHGAWLASRPAAAEARAIEGLARLSEETRAHVHVVHVSSAEGVEAIGRARSDGAHISGETCPHYLFFDADELPAGATRFKCAPPIRGGADRNRLWEALRDGVLDLIVSDHSPCPPAMRRGDFSTSWGGIASLQLALSVTWTAARERGFGPHDLTQWMSTAPARLAGIERRKGAIAPGLDADLVIWDPDAEVAVRAEDLHHRHPETPYLGLRLAGRVERTFVRGRSVYDEGRFVGPPAGSRLR